MSPKWNSLISKTKQSGVAKKAPKSRENRNNSCRANLPKPRKVPNNYEKRKEFCDDDPPKVRPEGYDSPYRLIKEGDRIDVWWEGDDKFYRGTVKNLGADGKRRIEYDDGQVVYHFLKREVIVMVEKTLEKFLAKCYPEDVRKHESNHEPIHFAELATFLDVGHTILIYWSSMDSWFPAVVTRKSDAGLFSILYDDDDRQLLRMENETFRFTGDSAAIIHTSLVEMYNKQKE